MGMQNAAREMVDLAEQGYANRRQRFGYAWQEMLNHATAKVMAAEADKLECEKAHKETAEAFAAVQSEVNRLQKERKKAISKSKNYYERKAKFHQNLEEQKSIITMIEADIKTAKGAYSKALDKLGSISEDIHVKRRESSKKRLSRVCTKPVDSEQPKEKDESVAESKAVAGSSSLGTREDGVGSDNPPPATPNALSDQSEPSRVGPLSVSVDPSQTLPEPLPFERQLSVPLSPSASSISPCADEGDRIYKTQLERRDSQLSGESGSPRDVSLEGIRLEELTDMEIKSGELNSENEKNAADVAEPPQKPPRIMVTSTQSVDEAGSGGESSLETPRPSLAAVDSADEDDVDSVNLSQNTTTGTVIASPNQTVDTSSSTSVTFGDVTASLSVTPTEESTCSAHIFSSYIASPVDGPNGSNSTFSEPPNVASHNENSLNKSDSSASSELVAKCNEVDRASELSGEHNSHNNNTIKGAGTTTSGAEDTGSPTPSQLREGRKKLVFELDPRKLLEVAYESDGGDSTCSGHTDTTSDIADEFLGYALESPYFEDAYMPKGGFSWPSHYGGEMEGVSGAGMEATGDNIKSEANEFTDSRVGTMQTEGEANTRRGAFGARSASAASDLSDGVFAALSPLPEGGTGKVLLRGSPREDQLPERFSHLQDHYRRISVNDSSLRIDILGMIDSEDGSLV